MSDAIETQGFKLEIAEDPADVTPDWVEVKEITSFQAFDGQAAEIDVTHTQSTAKEFRMGLQDFGSFNADANYLPEDPGQVLVRAAKGSRVLQKFRATFSDASTAVFTAFAASSPISGGVDAKVDTSFALRISGDVVFA